LGLKSKIIVPSWIIKRDNRWTRGVIREQGELHAKAGKNLYGHVGGSPLVWMDMLCNPWCLGFSNKSRLRARGILPQL
jgi:hypothetical protein